jgi:hypothetical protein
MINNHSFDLFALFEPPSDFDPPPDLALDSDLDSLAAGGLSASALFLYESLR